MKWFLIKKTCSSKSFLNFRLSSTRLLIKWFLIKKLYWEKYTDKNGKNTIEAAYLVFNTWVVQVRVQHND